MKKQVAILPLLGKIPSLVEKAKEVCKIFRDNNIDVNYDISHTIARRYDVQDRLDTLYCITIDFETLENNTVSVRRRDTSKQERVSIEEIVKTISESEEMKI